MVNYLKKIIISTAFIIIGTCLFYVGIKTKFIVDNINNIVTFILIPATVYVMYRIILNVFTLYIKRTAGLFRFTDFRHATKLASC